MLGILKIAGSAVRGIGNFIKKRKAKKEAKLDARATKLANQRAELAKLGGDPPLGNLFNAADIFKISGGADSLPTPGELGAPPGVSERIAAMQKTGGGSTGGGVPVWLWPVVGVAALLLLPKLLGGRK